jgi:hypothetical protein
MHLLLVGPVPSLDPAAIVARAPSSEGAHNPTIPGVAPDVTPEIDFNNALG